jgi:hypothetical protein
LCFANVLLDEPIPRSAGSTIRRVGTADIDNVSLHGIVVVDFPANKWRHNDFSVTRHTIAMLAQTAPTCKEIPESVKATGGPSTKNSLEPQAAEAS